MIDREKIERHGHLKRQATELERLANQHDGLAHQYKEHAHKWRDSPLGDAYTTCSETHSNVALLLREKSVEFAEAAGSEGG